MEGEGDDETMKTYYGTERRHYCPDKKSGCEYCELTIPALKEYKNRIQSNLSAIEIGNVNDLVDITSGRKIRVNERNITHKKEEFENKLISIHNHISLIQSFRDKKRIAKKNIKTLKYLVNTGQVREFGESEKLKEIERVASSLMELQKDNERQAINALILFKQHEIQAVEPKLTEKCHASHGGLSANSLVRLSTSGDRLVLLDRTTTTGSEDNMQQLQNSVKLAQMFIENYGTLVASTIGESEEMYYVPQMVLKVCEQLIDLMTDPRKGLYIAAHEGRRKQSLRCYICGQIIESRIANASETHSEAEHIMPFTAGIITGCVYSKHQFSTYIRYSINDLTRKLQNAIKNPKESGLNISDYYDIGKYVVEMAPSHKCCNQVKSSSLWIDIWNPGLNINHYNLNSILDEIWENDRPYCDTLQKSYIKERGLTKDSWKKIRSEHIINNYLLPLRYFIIQSYGKHYLFNTLLSIVNLAEINTRVGEDHHTKIVNTLHDKLEKSKDDIEKENIKKLLNELKLK